MLIYLTSEEEAAKGEAAAKHAWAQNGQEACMESGPSPTGPEASMEMREASAVIPAGRVGMVSATSANLVEDDGDHSCQPVGRFALRALAAIYNRVQPPLGDALLGNPRLNGHGNSPLGVGVSLTACRQGLIDEPAADKSP
jgi:hypothetical protein